MSDIINDKRPFPLHEQSWYKTAWLENWTYQIPSSDDSYRDLFGRSNMGKLVVCHDAVRDRQIDFNILLQMKLESRSRSSLIKLSV